MSDDKPKDPREGKLVASPEQRPDVLRPGEAVDQFRPGEVITSETSEEVVVAAESWTGPLPHPEALAQFKEVDPSFPDRIMKMAEAEQKHRHEREKDVLGYANNKTKRGQIFGLVIGVIGMVVTAYVAHDGHPIAASIVAALDMGGLVSIFVIGQRRRARSSLPPPEEQQLRRMEGEPDKQSREDTEHRGK